MPANSAGRLLHYPFRGLHSVCVSYVPVFVAAGVMPLIAAGIIIGSIRPTEKS
jgi:hypothetical protein